MGRKRKTIITNNKEIYTKFNQLNFVSEIILNNVKDIQITKIVNNVNRDGMILDVERVGDRFIITKRAPLNFNIYLK